MNSLIKNNDKANDGLKTLRLILESLSDLDLGKFVGEIRIACEDNPTDLKNSNSAIFDFMKSWRFCPNCAIKWENDSNSFGCWNCGYEALRLATLKFNTTNRIKQWFLYNSVIGSIYHWAITNLPYWIMYKHTWIDTQHKMWLPRWGYSKRQMDEAKKIGNELYDNIKWE